MRATAVIIVAVAALAGLCAGAAGAQAAPLGASACDDAYAAFQAAVESPVRPSCAQLEAWRRRSHIAQPHRTLPAARETSVPRLVPVSAPIAPVRPQPAPRRPAGPAAAQARKAYYRGDVETARRLAQAGGERWIAGLAAYRQGLNADAMQSFESLAADPAESGRLRAAAAYWAARSARSLGLYERANDDLALAAGEPGAFYGMLAQRELGIESLAAAPQAAAAPSLEPAGGFTLEPALVYAVVRNESGFHPRAVSSAGAVGLMQVMPATAAMVTGDASFRWNASALRDPARNLRIGQDYLGQLLGGPAGGDVVRALAAYNAGPGALQRTERLVGSDSLMLMESMPAAETRDYVEKVMASYWTYQRRLGGSPEAPAVDVPQPQPPRAPARAQAAVSWWPMILAQSGARSRSR